MPMTCLEEEQARVAILSNRVVELEEIVDQLERAEQQRDRLLEAVQPFLLGDPPAARSPEQRHLYELAGAIEKEMTR